jgi:hypothetical protein
VETGYYYRDIIKGLVWVRQYHTILMASGKRRALLLCLHNLQAQGYLLTACVFSVKVVEEPTNTRRLAQLRILCQYKARGRKEGRGRDRDRAEPTSPLTLACYPFGFRTRCS